MASKCYCLRWAVNLHRLECCEQDWRRAIQCIQPEEWLRIDKFRFREDELASLIGRLLLRQATRQLSGLPWKAIEFKRTEKWKPYLANSGISDFSLNISHQGDWIVLGASCTKNIGVDVMNTREFNRKMHSTVDEYINFMKKQFSQAEIGKMKEQIDDHWKLMYFYRFWCLKESIIKATGVGIHDDLSSVDFRVKTHELSMDTVVNDTLYYDNDDAQKKWIFEESLLDSEHCVAVCRQQIVPNTCALVKPITFRQITTFSELLTESDLINKQDGDAKLPWEIFTEKPHKPTRGNTN